MWRFTLREVGMVLTHVERVLLNYCQPGLHEYGADPASSEFEQCHVCGRRQRIDGSTCMLCEAEGTGGYTLAARDDRARIDGPLCSACSRELHFRGAVRQWTLAGERAA